MSRHFNSPLTMTRLFSLFLSNAYPAKIIYQLHLCGRIRVYAWDKKNVEKNEYAYFTAGPFGKVRDIADSAHYCSS